MLRLLTLPLILTSIAATGSVTPRGPFLMTVPVRGVAKDSLEKLEESFRDRFGRNAVKLQLLDGSLVFLAGGESPKALVRLSEIGKAVRAAGLEIDPMTWRLKPQMLGLSVTVQKPFTLSELKKQLRAAADADVAGVLFERGGACVVAHFEKPVDYAALNRALRKHGVRLDDLVWGHWDHGWGIESDEHRHAHEVGATLRPAKDR